MTDFNDEDDFTLDEGNADPDYLVSDHAIADDKPASADPDAPNKSILLELQKYCRQAISEHNSFDIIDLTEQAKMTPTQQIAMHKCVVQHLRNIKSQIDNKIKEL